MSESNAGQIIVRQTPDQSNALTISESSGTLIQTIKRTSGLQAPIMLLLGHQGEIFTVRFNPSGEHIASGSFDRTILLWNTYGDCINYGVLKGHNGAIMELQWSRDSRFFRALQIKLLAVSSARRGNEILVSGSDDGTIKIWDLRQKDAVDTFIHQYQITATCFSEAGDLVFAGCLDNDITAWDLRKKAHAYILKGHQDTISGIRLSPDGSYLLSNAMDNTVRVWDVKPFAPTNRLLKIFEGAPHSFEKNLIRPAWSSDGSQIASGSGDRTVMIWDFSSRKILYKLPGHKGCVNEVDFHPKEPIIVSGSTDRQIFLGEINPSSV
ncbi:unnamed protein product [Rhizophagus irregularis]|nr:unnamed protein product [Rhizophagus irregularis]